ncbi:MAG: hypothetical protein JO199_08375 [Candidatus Eremiobacteraeota bacterium]|nr:hypothetical protein [Candidatus Eremiobacteraeota bacterium]
MSGGHFGDDAALYALGILDDRERRTVEEHAARCAACAHLLAAAENDVTAASATQTAHDVPDALTRRVEQLFSRGEVIALHPKRARPPIWRSALAAAVAAALVAGIFPAAYFWQRDAAMQQAMANEAAAMNRLASTPHRTVAFSSPNAAPEAHVMYGNDGSWYVVLVRGASHALSVAWMHDGQQTMLGTVEPHGDVAMLYLPKSHRMDRLALMDGSEIVAQAQLAY